MDVLINRQQRRLIATVGFTVLTVFAGCRPEADPSLFGEQSVVVAPDGGTVDVGTGVASKFDDLSGTWMQIRDVSVCVNTLGQEEEVRSRTLAVVRVEQNGLRLDETYTICSVETTPVINIETVIPSAVIDAANPIEVQSAMLGNTVGSVYSSGIVPEIWGIEFEDPLSEEMPTDPADERLLDTDRDGAPGATLKVGGDLCDLHVAQRSLATARGFLQEDGTLEGTASVHNEQYIIGATNAFCANNFSQNRANDTYSFWRMVRVDRDGLDLDTDNDGLVSCAEASDAVASVYTWEEPDDARCALANSE